MVPSEPYFAWRGAFGRALKELACSCPRGGSGGHKESCAFSFLFETPLVKNFLPGSSSLNGPHPLLFSRLELIPHELMLVGGTFTADLILIGSARNQLFQVLAAIERLGIKGMGQSGLGFRLIEVSRWNGSGWIQGLSGPFDPPAPLPALDGDRWEFRTIQPLALRRMGRILRAEEVTFREWMIAILRRLKELNALCEGPSVIPEEGALMEAAEHILLDVKDYQLVIKERFSKRQGRRHPLTGFAGVFEAHGHLEPFGPLFRLGELFNVGKSLSFGFGQFAVTAVSGTGQEAL